MVVRYSRTNLTKQMIRFGQAGSPGVTGSLAHNMLLPSPPSLLFSYLPVFAGEDKDDYDHDHDDDDDDVIRILIMKSRAGQFLNMKNWDDSTNYAIPIARCDEKCALIEKPKFHKKSRKQDDDVALRASGQGIHLAIILLLIAMCRFFSGVHRILISKYYNIDH